MADDDFEFRIGRSTADRSLNRELLIAGHRAGRQVRRSIKGRRFTGERIGRGSGVGRLLSSSDRFAGPRARRVVVKARIVRLGKKGRSEEHTSALQSLMRISYAVFCLKKKKSTN